MLTATVIELFVKHMNEEDAERIYSERIGDLEWSNEVLRCDIKALKIQLEETVKFNKMSEEFLQSKIQELQRELQTAKNDASNFKEALRSEERDCIKVMQERDYYQDCFDELVNLMGVDNDYSSSRNHAEMIEDCEVAWEGLHSEIEFLDKRLRAESDRLLKCGRDYDRLEIELKTLRQANGPLACISACDSNTIRGEILREAASRVNRLIVLDSDTATEIRNFIADCLLSMAVKAEQGNLS